MPNSLLNALGRHVVNDEFKVDAATFFSLHKAAVDKMVELVNKYRTFSIPAAGLADFEGATNRKGEGIGVFAAARVLRDAVRTLPEALRDQELSAFALMIGADSYDPASFSSCFADIPTLDAKERRSDTVLFAPNLVEFSMAADLRMMIADIGQFALVPVCFARLEFDEPVAGQRSHFFQVTEDLLATLESEVKRIRGLLSEARERFPVDDSGKDDDETSSA